MITYQTTIKLHETDAAGVLFFASKLKIAHDAYEQFLKRIGFPIHSFIDKTAYFLPIVHTEADYHEQLHAGDDLSVAVFVEKIGHTSFVLAYTFHTADGKVAGQVKTVHVSVNKKSQKKIPLPDDLRAALQKHLMSSSA